MLTKNINYKNFLTKSNNLKIKKDLNLLLKQKLEVLNSLKNNYKYSYSKSLTKKLKKFNDIRIIGMGGSVLGSKAIHEFFKNRIKKNFIFVDNLNNNVKCFKDKKKHINLIISKSGNTLETISNASILINKRDKNIFITQNKESYLKI